MNKTIHRELIKKGHYQPHMPSCIAPFKDDAILSDIIQGMKPQLQEIGRDLLSPRAAAIAELLRMARN